MSPINSSDLSLKYLEDTLAIHQVFISSLIAGTITFLVEALVFIVLVRHLSHLYLAASEKMPPSKRLFDRPTKFIEWIKPLFTPEEIVLQKRGFDTYLYIRFIKMVTRIMTALAVCVAPVLIIVNIYGSYENRQPGMFWFSMGNISRARFQLVWVHVGILSAIVGSICFLIRREQINYVSVCRDIQRCPRYRIRPSSRTILVRDIPSYQLSEMALTAVFGIANSGIRKITICVNYAALDSLVRQRNYWTMRVEDGILMLIERAQLTCKRDQKGVSIEEWNDVGRRKAEGVGRWIDHDDIWEDDVSKSSSETGSVIHHDITGDKDYENTGRARAELERATSSSNAQHLWKGYMNRREYWDEIDHPRRELARINKAIDEQIRDTTYPRLASCFVCFNTIEDAFEACRKSLPETMLNATTELVLHPQDIRWAELTRSAFAHMPLVPSSIRLCLHAALTYITLSCVAGLLVLLGQDLVKGPLAWYLKVPPVILSIFTNFFLAYSFILTWAAFSWVAEFQAIGEANPVSRARISCRIQSLSLYWSLWSSFAIGLAPNDITLELLAVIRLQEGISVMLFENILRIGTSACFFQLVSAMQSTAGSSVRLRALLKSSEISLSSTPRDVWREKTTIPSVDWPLAYNPISVPLAVGLCFGLTSPLLLPVIWVSIALVSMSQKFAMFYIESPEYDTRGMFFRRALDHVFVGLYIMEAFSCLAITTISRDPPSITTYIMIAYLVVTFVCTAGFHIWSGKSLDFALFEQQDGEEDNPNNIVMPDDDLPGSRTLLDLPYSERRILIDNAYKHPLAKFRKLTVWIPQDHVGISDDEIKVTRDGEYTNEYQDENGVSRISDFIRISNDGAAVGHNGRTIIAKDPPEHSEYDDLEL